MTQKVAVALIHGIGPSNPDFGKAAAKAIQKRCQAVCGEDVVVERVYWADVIQDKESDLWKRVNKKADLRWREVRRYMVDFLADAFAYQITDSDRQLYDDIHAEFAATLKRLADQAGGNAPLCIVAYSLGSIIASNFIYDLQKPDLIAEKVRAQMGDTPLDRGETLNLLCTLGSPLALWSLRYHDFGRPIHVPSPDLKKHYPDLTGKWINYYDQDDAFAFPLRHLNDAYKEEVKKDVPINVGSLLTSWNPLSHMGYWKSKEVIAAICEGVIATWEKVNQPATGG